MPRILAKLVTADETPRELIQKAAQLHYSLSTFEESKVKRNVKSLRVIYGDLSAGEDGRARKDMFRYR